MSDGITRREFVKGAAALGAAGIWGGFAGPLFAYDPKVDSKKASRVVIGYSSKVVDESRKIDQETVDRLVHESLMRLTGTKTHDDAWRSLFDKTDVVGLKVNCAAGRPFSTKPQIAKAAVDGLVRIGVPAENIIIWERTDQELEASGFTLNKTGPGARCYGTMPDIGYDTTGAKSGDHEYKLSKLVSQKVTAIINLPMVKDHDNAGTTCSLKNNYGSFLFDTDNIGPLHTNNCTPCVAEVNAIPAIRDKTRLILTDAIYCGYNAGPGYVPGKQWYENAIMASVDPVAMDAVAWEMIEKARKRNGFPTLTEAGRPPLKWLKVASDFGLGHHVGTMIDRVTWTV